MSNDRFRNVLAIALILSWALLLVSLLPLQQGYEWRQGIGVALSIGGIVAGLLVLRSHRLWLLAISVFGSAFLVYYFICLSQVVATVQGWRTGGSAIDTIGYINASKLRLVAWKFEHGMKFGAVLVAHQEFVMPLVQAAVCAVGLVLWRKRKTAGEQRQA